MKILVIGGGGREHAICKKIAESKRVSKLYCAPGNAGIAKIAECVPIGVMEFDKMAEDEQGNATWKYEIPAEYQNKNEVIGKVSCFE